MSGFSTRIQHVLVGSSALAAVFLSGCQPEAPGLGAAGGSVSAGVGLAAPLSDAEFDALGVDEQYRVVNKLLGTLYSGMPVSEFYDLSSGNALKNRKDPSFTLSTLRKQLQTNLPDEQREQLDLEIIGDEEAVDDKGNASPVEAMYYFDDNRPKQMPLARIQHYPLSRNSLSQWMAWHLANTIMFSPAEELDSADITDVQNLFRRLDLSIMQHTGIRSMVATHQRSVQNWRRFRSPEDNTREMMEIYLGIFDNDAEVPAASRACQDLYLTDEQDGYKLAYTDYPNSKSVLVLDKYVLSCGDFYDVVASHPLLIPRVTSVLVDYFYAGRDTDERLAITQAISATNPKTFEDIFMTLLFSKSYLLDTERAKSFEESFMGMAKRLDWQPNPDMLRGMVSGRGALARTEMAEMGWSSMSFKLGRVSSVPMDSLSFGNYHKAMREYLMLDERRWRVPLGLKRPDAPTPRPIDPPTADASTRELAAYKAALKEYDEAVAELNKEERGAYNLLLVKYESDAVLYRKVEDMTVSQLTDYLFLTAIQRRASVEERKDLIRIYRLNEHLDEDYGNQFARSDHQDDIAVITLDYLSRLPETYFLPRLR
ncbi:MAG: hypothetical protein V3U76_10540 [Granulosicoccus sp.]